MENNQQKQVLRFGIMCDSTTFPAWQAQCIRNLLSLDNVQPELLIINSSPINETPLPTQIKRLLQGKIGLWRFYDKFFGKRRCAALQPIDLTEELADVESLQCKAERRGRFSDYFSHHDVQSIKHHDLDFIIRFSFGIIRGDILQSARYGIWSFHHGDPDKYRGMPPGFWEIYNNDPVTGVILQRLTEKLDSGTILHRGYFRTEKHSYPKHLSQILLGCTDWPARICRELQAGMIDSVNSTPITSSAPIYHSPTNSHMLRFFISQLGNKINNQIRNLLLIDHWNIGIIEQPIGSLVDENRQLKPRWLFKTNRHHFLADPFVIEHNGKTAILAEEYDYKIEKGRIVFANWPSNADPTPPELAFDLTEHLSYPYLIKHEGDILCIPETYQARAVYLYKAIEFPHHWERQTTLLSDRAIVDSTIFCHNDYWWLFATDHDQGAETKLYAWYSPTLTGPWQAHLLNPLKTDVRSSRPAGTPFVHQGNLYRPAQNCALGYGSGVTINQITRLSPTEFNEIVAASISPDPKGPYPNGLHTLCAHGNITIIDGRRDIFIPTAFRHALLRKLRKFTRVLRKKV